MMQRMTSKPVFCVRNDPDDTLGITERVLVACGLAVEKLDGFAPDVRWPGLDAIGGLIVFGGEMNVDEVDRHPYLLRERELMRSAVDVGVPVLGICLGAQMLARTLGARVHRAPVRELGFRPVRLIEAGLKDPLLGAFGRRPCVFQWHEDTFDLPKDATLLAVGDDVANQAFRYGEHAWGVQFHFEIDRDGVEAWLRAAQPTLEPVWQRTVDELREELATYLEQQQDQARALLVAFAAQVATANPP
jgi:GMP synthase (glutamine-hydrolysing)